MTFTESFVEDAILASLEALEYTVYHGPDIAAGEPGDPDYRDVVRKTIITCELRAASCG